MDFSCPPPHRLTYIPTDTGQLSAAEALLPSAHKQKQSHYNVWVSFFNEKVWRAGLPEGWYFSWLGISLREEHPYSAPSTIKTNNYCAHKQPSLTAPSSCRQRAMPTNRMAAQQIPCNYPRKNCNPRWPRMTPGIHLSFYFLPLWQQVTTNLNSMVPFQT